MDQEHRSVAERLKAGLLEDFRLRTEKDLRSYWQQVKWSKPNLVELAKGELEPGYPTLLGRALRRLDPNFLARASEQLNPFGWLLAAVDVVKWVESSATRKVPWMERIWLATASQLRAQWKLIDKAHGWAGTWENLRRNPKELRNADDYFLAELSHAEDSRRAELLAWPPLAGRLAKARQERDEAFLRRFRRAKQAAGKRAGVTLGEKFMVQYWIEMPTGLPGLCFFADKALHQLLKVFGLHSGDSTVNARAFMGAATKQTRVRLGLIQAGAKRHLIEQVDHSPIALVFKGTLLTRPYIFENEHGIYWGGRLLWPR